MTKESNFGPGELKQPNRVGETFELKSKGVDGQPVMITVQKIEDGLNRVVDVRPVEGDRDK